MANSESTAVNELIELASLKPLDGSDDAGLFAPARSASRDSGRSRQPVPTIRAVVPLSPARAASGTKTNLKPAAEVPGRVSPDVGSGGVSRPSRLTTIAPVRTEDSAPLVVSASDPWSLEPTQAAAEPVASEPDPVGPIEWEAAEPNVVVTPSVAVALPKLPPLPPATRPSVAIGTPVPELFSRAGARATLPPPVRMRAPTGSITVDTVDPRGPTAAMIAPVAPPPIPSVTLLGQMAKPSVAPKLPPPIAPAMLQVDALEDDRPTEYFDREELTPAGAVTRNKLIIPMIAVGVAGALLGTILAMRGGGSSQPSAVLAATPAAESQPAEAPKPVEPPKVETVAAAIPAPAVETAPVAVTEIATTVTAPPTEAAGPLLVDVRFDSQPDGATVMIVDRGKTSLLGTTPTLGSLDPSRAYDAIFTTPGQPTRVEHFDPKQTHHLSITLDGKAAPAHVAAAAIAQPATAHVEVAAPKHTAQVVAAPKHVASEAPVAKHAAPVVAAPKKVAVLDPQTNKATSKTNGLLMISSKPPCSIFIDGKATGLLTPQRAISLAAGGHNVTLVNAKEKIKKTIAIEITASKSTKLIQDLMKK